MNEINIKKQMEVEEIKPLEGVELEEVKEINYADFDKPDQDTKDLFNEVALELEKALERLKQEENQNKEIPSVGFVYGWFV